jgi:hypothetical protein
MMNRNRIEMVERLNSETNLGYADGETGNALFLGELMRNAKSCQEEITECPTPENWGKTADKALFENARRTRRCQEKIRETGKRSPFSWKWL